MKLSLPVLVIVLFFQNFTKAQTAIQTSFESPQFTAGNVSGQNAWTVSNGSAVVSSSKAKTGSQALHLSASNSALLVNHVAYAGNVTGLRTEVYADMWLNPASFATKGISISGYDLFGGSSKRIFVVELTTDNIIKAYNGSSGNNIGTWTANTWVRISMKVDFNSEKYRVAINNVLSATEFAFREAYAPTASGAREAGTKEYHSLRINHTTDTQIATSDIVIDDIYVGTNPIPDVSFGASSTQRTITVTQPAYGTITLSPSKTTYNIDEAVTATLILPDGYINYGWTGNLSGTENVKSFPVSSNMVIGANTGVNAANPPVQFTITVSQPENGLITLTPSSADGKYYKETVVTATVSNEACYQFNGWTGDFSGSQTSKTFTVSGDVTIGVDIVENTSPSIKRTVSSVTAFKDALNVMNPGDTVEVENGSYNLSSLTIRRSGCRQRPIIIRAKNQGQAILNGNTALVLESVKYITLQGFSFQSTSIGTGIKVLNCSRVRITKNSFAITETSSCNWVYIGDTFGSTEPLKSGHNKVDYNVFDGKTQPGKFILLDGNINQQSQHDTISYNLFKNNGPRAANEKESIRIGVSTLSKSSGYTVVEYNLFQDCDGDPEIVSVKSCNNIIRYNTFQRCLGTVCLRQGNGSIVEGNYFFGEGKTAIYTNPTNGSSSEIGCGGVRVYGKDHQIINNYFDGLTGSKWDAALTITNGDVTNSSTSLADHFLPENVVAAFNTFVNNQSDIEIGFENGGKYTKAPINCSIANSIVVENKNPIVKSFSSTSLAGVSFSNNIMYPTGTSSMGIAYSATQIKNIDPLLVQPDCTAPDDLCNQRTAFKVMRLSPLSPAINAATGTYSNVTLDYENQIRTGIKDIGADEYKGNTPIFNTALSEDNIGPNAVSLGYAYNYASSKQAQSITFTELPSKEIGDADFDLSATASSGLGVTYTSSNPDVAIIINGKVHIVGAGSTNIIASQSGNETWAAASDVSRELLVTLPYTLPASNFSVQVSDETCSSSNNGAIAITALQELNYQALISGNGLNATYPFSSSVNIPSLNAGTYSVCITVEGHSTFGRCYEVTIAEPPALSVYSSVNAVNKKLILNLSGGTSYYITLNGKSFNTSSNSVSLDLSSGVNSLQVSTDKACQSVVNKSFFLGDQKSVYPNPFQHSITIAMGNDISERAIIFVSSLSGEIVYSKHHKVDNRQIEINLPGLPAGNYILKVKSNLTESTSKIVKQ